MKSSAKPAESLSALSVYLPSLKIISGIMVELVKSVVATCLLLYSGTVFLQTEEVLLEIQ